MRYLLIIALLFSSLPLLSSNEENIEVRLRHYSSGQLKERAEALVLVGEAPVYHGTIKRYSEEGGLVQDGHYQLGKMHGRWRYWSDGGLLVGEAEYSAGQGQLTNYNADGKKSTQGPMTEDLRVGLWTQWYPSGRLHARGEMQADQMEGTWTFWSDEEPARQQIVVFINGERQP